MEGEGSPQNDLDFFKGIFASWVPNNNIHSFRGHLLVGSPIIIYWVELFQLAKAFYMGYFSFTPNTNLSYN